MFGMFSKKKAAQPDATAWAAVAGKIAGTLWHLMQTNPQMLANPYARVVLSSSWNVGVAADKREPERLLGPNDVSFVLLREDESALNEWIQQLKANSSPVFQQIATEEYAKKLTRTLMSGVQVVD